MGFIWISEQTAQQSKALRETHPELTERLRAQADAWLEHPDLSVTQFPSRAASGDPHDFYSEGPYWWPDPDKADGLPYIRRDGYRNPNNYYEHPRALSELADGVHLLSLAGYLLENPAYFEKAAHLLRVWFIDEKTRMNPHLNYGQAIPGICTGRGIGIITLSSLDRILHGLGYLEQWPQAEETLKGVRAWLEQMLDWLLHSPNGVDESIHGNNHETWWSVHAAGIAAYLGKKEELEQLFERYLGRILPNQMQPDGSMPRELGRTRSLHYSTYNLNAMAMFCELAWQHGVDLWHAVLPDGRCIEKGIDFVLPYLVDDGKWPYEEIDTDPLDRQLFLQLAALRLDRSDYLLVNGQLAPGGKSVLGPLEYLTNAPELA